MLLLLVLAVLSKDECYRLNVHALPRPNPYVEVSIVMVIGGGAFGGSLGLGKVMRVEAPGWD